MNFDEARDELLSTASGVASRASAAVDAFEIFLSHSRSITVGINGGAVAADDGEVEGAGVRVAVGRRIGFASATGLGREALLGAIEEAIRVAKSLGHEDRNFEGFADPRPAGRDGPVDDALLAMSGGEVVRRTGRLYSVARAADPRIVSAEVQVSVEHGAYAVVNSSGVEAATRGCGLSASAYVTAAEGDRRKTGSDFIVSRRLVDFEGVAEVASRNALAMLPAKPLGRAVAIATVWDPVTAAQLLETALGNSINGRSVHEGRSAFNGKLGQKVGSTVLTVHDDGQHPEGLSTAAVDMEGIPQGRTPILESGVLRGFLYDHYFGRLAGGGATGNARRGGTEVFASTPHIARTTLVVAPGKGSLEDVVASVDDGVLVTDSLMGLGHANVVSGDFSIVGTNPFLIRNGAVAGALEPVTLAGNLYRCLSEVGTVGADVRMVGGVLTPSLLIAGLTVTG